MNENVQPTAEEEEEEEWMDGSIIPDYSTSSDERSGTQLQDRSGSFLLDPFQDFFGHFLKGFFKDSWKDSLKDSLEWRIL